MALLGHVPAEGEEATSDGLKLVVKKMKGNRIQELLVSWEPAEEAGSEEEENYVPEE